MKSISKTTVSVIYGDLSEEAIHYGMKIDDDCLKKKINRLKKMAEVIVSAMSSSLLIFKHNFLIKNIV